MSENSSSSSSSSSSTSTSSNSAANSSDASKSPDSSSSSSLQNGCVSCDNNVSCPKCADDEYCVTTSLTCTQCPRTYCEKKASSSSDGGSSPASSSLIASPSSSSSSSSNKVGPIVGGVVGGVAAVLIIAVLAFMYYRYYKRKRSALPPDSEYMEKDMHPVVSGGGSPLHPGMLRSGSTNSAHVRARNKRNRSSAATIQTSTASNIIPVAYIPGVTTNLTKKNLRKGPGRGGRKFYQDSDRKSHITLGSSILGDDDDDDDDDVDNVDSVRAAATGDKGRDSPGSDGPNLTTAIRARPKLVQIDELAEEEGEEHEQEQGQGQSQEQRRGQSQEQRQQEYRQDAAGGSAGQLSNIQDTSPIGTAGHSNSVLDIEQRQSYAQSHADAENRDIRRDSYNTMGSYAISESRDPFHSTLSVSSDSNSEGSFILDLEIASNHNHNHGHS